MFQGAAGQAKPTDLTVSDDSLTNEQDVIHHLDQNGWKDENICQISKTGKMAAFRTLSSSLLKKIRCQICNNRHLHNIVSERTIYPKLKEKLRMLCSKSEMRNFFDKRKQLIKVFGNADLLLNPMQAQCCLCGTVLSLGHFNGILIQNDKLRNHVKSIHAKPGNSCGSCMAAIKGGNSVKCKRFRILLSISDQASAY